MSFDQSILIDLSEKYRKGLYEQKRVGSIIGHSNNAFLCHSHLDKVLVEGLLQLFKDEGVELYVDWMDESLPDTPDRTTANMIQKKIESYKYLLYLATENSSKSIWCPWEIGFADGKQKEIIIIQTSKNGPIYGQEYLQLYSRIDIGFTPDNRAILGLFEIGKEGKALSNIRF